MHLNVEPSSVFFKVNLKSRVVNSYSPAFLFGILLWNRNNNQDDIRQAYIQRLVNTT